MWKNQSRTDFFLMRFSLIVLGLLSSVRSEAQERFSNVAGEPHASPYDEAAAYLDLGLNHRKLLEVDFFLPAEPAREQVVKAVNAIKQAVSVYEGIRNENSNEEERVAHHIASCFLEIGKTYSLSPDDSQYALAMDSYLSAKNIYQKILSNQKSDHEAEIGWAYSCLRVGVTLLTMEPSSVNLESLFEDNPEEQKSESSDRVLQIGEQAEKLFMDAEPLLQKAIELEQDPMEQVYLQRHLARTLQNLGTTAVIKNDLKESAKYGEQALVLHETVMNKLPQGSIELDDTVIHIAEVLYNLADTYLQLGNYDASKEKYRQAMVWYERYSISEPPAMGDMADDDEVLHEYEQALKEYNETLVDGVEVPVSVGEMGEYPYSEDDERYRGDLHASLGSLYMSKGDLLHAVAHLTQAMDLYTSIGEQEGLSMADIKFNLAMLYLRRGEFKYSADYNDQALDTYRKVVGNGKNPMQVDRMGMPEKDMSYIQKQESRSCNANGSASKRPHEATKQDTRALNESKFVVAGGDSDKAVRDEL